MKFYYTVNGSDIEHFINAFNINDAVKLIKTKYGLPPDRIWEA